MALNRVNRGLAHRTARIFESLAFPDFPLFLCPALIIAAPRKQLHSSQGSSGPGLHSYQQLQQSSHSAAYSTSDPSIHISAASTIQLPQNCAGCGALTQTLFAEEPGFYTLTRRSVKSYLEGYVGIQHGRRNAEETLLAASLATVDEAIQKSLGLESPLRHSQNEATPVCDRCHKLVHHHSGDSIHHPSIQSIHDTILESPHKYNHVYHVLDAADFPMSLIPGLHRALNLNPQRSLNRRSQAGKYSHGRKTEVSFIITRSDLLAPLKSQVDSLMPYLIDTLRDALGSFGKDVRLGNVRCVSAKRGWWTKEIKEDIWNRGGGGWMVGKVNVGKSQLFESVFPKGRRSSLKFGDNSNSVSAKSEPTHDRDAGTIDFNSIQSWEGNLAGPQTATLNTISLLPPARPETNYPQMPVVSSMPGTTASPIRVPFGNGKGELVDLPGLSRGDLEMCVQPQHRQSLVMNSRVVPEQLVVKPGQSLLLGGFIRITPTTPDLIVLAYAFTPILPHLTSTEKAIGVQKQERESGVENIANPGIGEKVVSAGKFHLKWDVTKQRTGPITARSAAGIKVDRLPFRVLSTDILIEGCGWVELVTQVRKRMFEQPDTEVHNGSGASTNASRSHWPEVEVFSPEGKYVSSRRPLGAWVLCNEKKRVSNMKGRPRRSMKGEKKKAKALRRLVEGSLA